MSSIIIHHHNLVHKDADGTLWLTAGIGLWVNELAKHFDKVVLLFFESPKKKNTHDTPLTAANIEWVSLGKMGRYLDYFEKIARIKAVCKTLNDQHDYLLVRGFTPMQSLIWKTVRVRIRKSYYLVRSPRQPRELTLSPSSFIAFFVNKMRERDFRRMIRRKERIIANSFQISLEIEKEFGLAIPFAPSNVVSLQNVPPYTEKTVGAPITLLYVGRMLAMKGIIELIEAAGRLYSTHKMDVQVQLVGDGHPDFIARCKSVAESLGIADRLHMPGRVNFGAELFGYFGKADMFVLPTYTEGFPRVYWEAAVNSCPGILTAVGGIPYIVKDRINGLLIEPRSAEAICNAVLALKEDEHLRHAITQNAYELAREHSLERGIEQLVSHIKA